MSDKTHLKEDIPKIIIGSVKYPNYDTTPSDHPIKNRSALIQIVKRSYEAGARGCLLHLHNEEIIDVANVIKDECPEIEFMFIIKYEQLNDISSILKPLKSKPLILFLAAPIADQRDSDIISKHKKAMLKNAKYMGLHSREPIGTISHFVTDAVDVDIYLTPFNLLGFGVQNRPLLEMILNSTENIYISTNPLANGKLKTRQALEYISSHKIHGILVELEDLEDMLETIKFGKYYLDTRDFLQITLEFEDNIVEICEFCGIGMERYYPPTGGSWFYCPICENTKQATEATYEKEKK